MAERADELSKALEGLEVDLDVLMAEVSFAEAVKEDAVKAPGFNQDAVHEKLKHMPVDQQGSLAETYANSSFEEQLRKAVASTPSIEATTLVAATKTAAVDVVEKNSIKTKPSVSLESVSDFVKDEAVLVVKKNTEQKKIAPKDSKIPLVLLSFVSGALLSAGAILVAHQNYLILDPGFSDVDPDAAFVFLKAYKAKPVESERALLELLTEASTASPLASLDAGLYQQESLESPLPNGALKEGSEKPPTEEPSPVESLGETQSTSAQTRVEGISDGADSVLSQSKETSLSQAGVAAGTVQTEESAMFCYVSQKDQLPELSSKVKSLKMPTGSTVNYIETAKVKNYYVAMSPQGQKKYSAARLKGSGIKESFVIKNGPYAGYLSLGLFSSRESAATYSSHLGSLGLSNLNILPNQKLSVHHADIVSLKPLPGVAWLKAKKCQNEKRPG